MIDLEDSRQVAEFVKRQMSEHKQFTLGTVGPDGKPWVVCLNLSYDQNFNFIWKSEKTTLHSENIISNPNVALCVFSEDDQRGDFGIYCSANAHEVSDEAELMRLLDARYVQKGKPMPEQAEFLGDSKSRIYYAEVTEMWLNDDRHIKTKVDLGVSRNH